MDESGAVVSVIPTKSLLMERQRSHSIIQTFSFSFGHSLYSKVESRLKTLMNLREKIETASQHKKKGNDLFKASNHKSALSSYNFAYLYLKGLDNEMGLPGMPTSTLSANEKQEIKALIVSVLSNIAMCYLALERFEDCISQCEKVLKVDAENSKANFRIAMAHTKMPNPDLYKAKQYLLNAAKSSPQDIGIRNELDKVKQQLDAANRDSDAKLRQNLKKSMRF